MGGAGENGRKRWATRAARCIIGLSTGYPQGYPQAARLPVILCQVSFEHLDFILMLGIKIYRALP